MTSEVTVVYENGVLRPLSPISLPEHARVRVHILTEEESRNDLRRAKAVLIAAGLVKPAPATSDASHVPEARRAELSRLYAQGGPLSDVIIDEREAR